VARYDAASVQEAVAIAERLRAEGRHDFFRGQIQPWTLRSSLQRQDGAAQLSAIQWLNRFRVWVSNTEGLWPIAADQDQAIAVAQHYGLPTDFIDVTPDPRVAAFFALDGRDPALTAPCCIVCLSSRDLARVWATRYANYRRPEIITMTVPNLWRLEAQQGAFLFCPYPDFEALYPVDRICFPPSAPDETLAADQIYPARKSALEILLDQFFQKRSIAQFNEQMREVMREHAFESPDERYYPDRLASGTLDTLASWNDGALRPWRYVTREAYQAVVSPGEILLTVSSIDDPVAAGRDAANAVADRLAREPDVRSRALLFVVRGLADVVQGPATSGLAGRLAQLWDGLRLLPYEPAEIAEGIGRCLALGVAMVRHNVANPNTQEAAVIFRDLGDESIVLVEFGQDDKSYSRAFVAEQDLRAIIRSDIFELLTPEYAESSRKDIRALLYSIYAPEKLFEFRPFARLFATRLAPIQVHTRQGQAIVYSPARLETFGMP
jgi:FRG domain-containing protein